MIVKADQRIIHPMTRIARVVVPGIPHHVIQRGNRRQQTFWTDSDYQHYLLLMKESCQQNEVSIWAYFLMPNHVHLVMVPETEEGLTKAIGQVHHRYTRMINFRQKWKGVGWVPTHRHETHQPECPIGHPSSVPRAPHSTCHKAFMGRRWLKARSRAGETSRLAGLQIPIVRQSKS